MATLSKSNHKARRLVFLLVPLVALLALWISFRNVDTTSEDIKLFTTSHPVWQQRSILNSCRLPARWIAWIRRTRLKVFGPKRTLPIESETIVVDSAVGRLLRESDLGPPVLIESGQSYWRLDSQHSVRLRDQLNHPLRPYEVDKAIWILTQGSVAFGSTRRPGFRPDEPNLPERADFQFRFDSWSSNETDLLASAVLLDRDGLTFKTNFAFEARFRLAAGESILVLGPTNSVPSSPRCAVLITPSL